MAGGKSEYLSTALLDHQLGGPDYTRPSTVYVGIYTTLPVGGSGGTEASGGGYARLSVTNNSTSFPGATAGTKSNGVAFTWSAFSADMGDFVGIGIFDASTSGNLLRWGPLSTARTVLSGEGFEIPIGGGTFTES